MNWVFDLEKKEFCSSPGNEGGCEKDASLLNIEPRFVDGDNGRTNLIVKLTTSNFGKVSPALLGDGRSFTIDFWVGTKTIDITVPSAPEFRGQDNNLNIRGVFDTHGLGIKPRKFSVNLNIHEQSNKFQLDFSNRVDVSDMECPAGSSPWASLPSQVVSSTGASISLNIDDIPGWLDKKLANNVNDTLDLLAIFTGNLKLLGFGHTNIEFNAAGTDLGVEIISELPNGDFSIPYGIIRKLYPELAENHLQGVLQISTDKNLREKIEADFVPRLISDTPNWPIGGLPNYRCIGENGQHVAVP